MQIERDARSTVQIGAILQLAAEHSDAHAAHKKVENMKVCKRQSWRKKEKREIGAREGRIAPTEEPQSKWNSKVGPS